MRLGLYIAPLLGAQRAPTRAPHTREGAPQGIERASEPPTQHALYLWERATRAQFPQCELTTRARAPRVGRVCRSGVAVAL